MRWRDGLSNDEKRRLREERIRKKEEWHKWFAWFPVTVGIEGKHKVKVWLSFVQRRGKCFYHRDGIYNWVFDYKETQHD
jgi:hypothetical protein